jgi:hypothetical protein
MDELWARCGLRSRDREIIKRRRTQPVSVFRQFVPVGTVAVRCRSMSGSTYGKDSHCESDVKRGVGTRLSYATSRPLFRETESQAAEGGDALS